MQTGNGQKWKYHDLLTSQDINFIPWESVFKNISWICNRLFPTHSQFKLWWSSCQQMARSLDQLLPITMQRLYALTNLNNENIYLNILWLYRPVLRNFDLLSLKCSCPTSFCISFLLSTGVVFFFDQCIAVLCNLYLLNLVCYHISIRKTANY